MSTTPSAMSERAPGLNYDPASGTPYIPPEGAATTPPPITAPPQRDPSTLQQQPGPNLLPGAKGSKVAGIAYMLDSVLKGYMKGREYGEQQKAYKANRLLQGLQFNAQNAAQQYIGFAQTNPEAVSKMFELDKLRSNQNPSPEDQKKILDLSSGKDVQQAQLYRDGSHTARAKMMEMYGNYINPPKKDKGKGKAKGGDQSGEQQNPILMAQSKDPREKSQGVWALASRFDPADIAVRQYASPEYLAQRQLSGIQSRSQLDFAQFEEKERNGTLKPEDKQKLDAFRTQRAADVAAESKPAAPKPPKPWTPIKSPVDNRIQGMMNPETERPVLDPAQMPADVRKEFEALKSDEDKRAKEVEEKETKKEEKQEAREARHEEAALTRQEKSFENQLAMAEYRPVIKLAETAKTDYDQATLRLKTMQDNLRDAM